MEGKATNLICLCFLSLLSYPQALGQATPGRREAIRARLAQIKAFSERIPAKQRKILSSGALGLLEASDKFDDLQRGLSRLQPARSTPMSQQSRAAVALAETQGLSNVSDPSQDVFSVLSGFTQSETHTAWCGDNIVVGFNDSGSFFESLLSNAGGVSLNGIALSNNQGASYSDLMFLNPGSDINNFLGGDPVLGCADENTFYYSSLFETGPPSAPITAVSVSKSTDGGISFADPVQAVAKDGLTHFLDKDWMAIDPTNPRKIYVTYTDFDLSGVCGPPSQAARIAIELVRSVDGGETWSTPFVIDQVCSPSSVPGLFVQGSEVVVNARGRVYVAWEFYDADFVTREIRLRRSNGENETFGAKVKVSDVVCPADCSVLQGAFRAAIDFQGLAVDRSATPNRGKVYITWHDGRLLQFPDLASPTGFYGYADALVSVSSNGGTTWSQPVRINQNVEPLPDGRGTDQYMPGIAVDKTGRVASCFYDRRLDPNNFLFDRFCAVSTDGGRTWTDSRQTGSSSPPFHAMDTLINPFYMGDYDGMASDFTGANSGFVGAFQIITNLGDPDIFAVKLH